MSLELISKIFSINRIKRITYIKYTINTELKQQKQTN